MTKHKKKQQKILKLCVQKKYIFNNKTSGNETKPSVKKCEGGNQNIRNIHKTVTIVNKKNSSKRMQRLETRKKAPETEQNGYRAIQVGGATQFYLRIEQ